MMLDRWGFFLQDLCKRRNPRLHQAAPVTTVSNKDRAYAMYTP